MKRESIVKKRRMRREYLITLLKLKIAIIKLSKTLDETGGLRYKVDVRAIRPYEHDLVTVKRFNSNKIRFEVREKEQNHKEPHFHITITDEGSGSYRIKDLSRIESNIKRKTEKELLKWAQENRQTLVDTWNKFHGYRVTVA